MTSDIPPVGSGLPGAVSAAPIGVDNRPSPVWDGEASRGEEAEGASLPEAGAQRAVPKPPVTGDQAVDEAMELVSDAFGADLDFQLQAYEAAHLTLQERLADVES